MYQTINVEIASAVATIWLNRPDVHNALDEVLIADLDAAFARLEGDTAVRVLVLAGRGRSFCAGADLHWMRRAASATTQENLLDARRLAAMLQRLARLSKPTVARVHGPALGGGVGLAAACDICIAAQGASFALSEVRLGLIPAVISPYVIRAMGTRQALRYMQTAESIAADRALLLGLAHEVVAANELDATIIGICASLCAGGPGSLAAAKALVLDSDAGPLGDPAIERSAQAIARQRASTEAQEGMAAFLARRAPAWRR